MNIKNLFGWLKNKFDSVIGRFGKKRKGYTIIVPDRKSFMKLHYVPDRGKEDSHTKIKRKMADKSRKINRKMQ
jgi:hypothetical protein